MTPEIIRKRDEAISSVGEYWYLDFKTKEIRRKPPHGFASIKQFLWKNVTQSGSFMYGCGIDRPKKMQCHFPIKLMVTTYLLRGIRKNMNLKAGGLFHHQIYLISHTGRWLQKEGMKFLFQKPIAGSCFFW